MKLGRGKSKEEKAKEKAKAEEEKKAASAVSEQTPATPPEDPSSTPPEDPKKDPKKGFVTCTVTRAGAIPIRNSKVRSSCNVGDIVDVTAETLAYYGTMLEEGEHRMIGRKGKETK